MRERAEPDRLMDALMDVVLDDGWEGVDEDAVASRAGLQRADFDRHFKSVADCYEQTYERNYAGFERLVFDAYGGLGWRDSLRGSAYAAARYLRDNIREVRFGAVPTAEGSEAVVPELMYLAVRPYLGHEVAKEELTIPAPPETVADA